MMHEDQHDQAIEDVLHALRNTEPPQGYEARIHNALLQATAEPHSSFLQNRHPDRSEAKPKDLLALLLPRMSWATAATCAVLFVFGIAMRTHLRHRVTPSTQAAVHTNQPSSRPTKAMLASNAPAATRRATHSLPRRNAGHNSITPTPRMETAILTHEYIPEPPLPLTKQERLVLHMMRRNTAQQLAEYTPDARARQLHEDAQAYHDYFAEKPLDGQPIYHQKISGGNQ